MSPPSTHPNDALKSAWPFDTFQKRVEAFDRSPGCVQKHRIFRHVQKTSPRCGPVAQPEENSVAAPQQDWLTSPGDAAGLAPEAPQLFDEIKSAPCPMASFEYSAMLAPALGRPIRNEPKTGGGPARPHRPQEKPAYGVPGGSASGTRNPRQASLPRQRNQNSKMVSELDKLAGRLVDDEPTVA